MKALLISTALCLGAGCRTIATSTVSSTPDSLPRLGKQTKSWEVQRNGELLGLVVLFQESGRVRDSIYVVRNPWHQDLGLVDGLGRAYRYLPHHQEPAWVGSGTILTGAQSILAVEGPCELVEMAGLVVRLVPGSTASTAEIEASEALTGSAAAPSPGGGLPQSR